MDENDIQARIARLRANLAALAQADADCLAELRSLCDALLAIHAKVSGAELLDPPSIREREGKPEPDIPLADDRNWHVMGPRLSCYGLRCQITFNPVRRTWVLMLDNSPTPMDRAGIMSTYTHQLAAWVVCDYPAAREKVEQRRRQYEMQQRLDVERIAEQAQRELQASEYKRRSAERMDEYFRESRNYLLLGVGVVIMFLLFLVAFRSCALQQSYYVVPHHR